MSAHAAVVPSAEALTQSGTAMTFNGADRPVAETLMKEVYAAPELAQAIEAGLYLGSQYHAKLAADLANTDLTGAPDLWKGYDGRVGELWRFIGSVGEQLMLSHIIRNDPVLADQWAESVFSANGSFRKQAVELLTGRRKKEVAGWYTEIIEKDPAVAALLASHAESNYALSSPKGYVSMLAHGIMRPYLFGNGAQFFHGDAVRAAGAAIDAVAGHKVPDNLVRLTLVALEAKEIKGMQEILDFAAERHRKHPMKFTPPPAAGPPQLEVPAAPTLPAIEVENVVLRQPFFVSTEYGQIHTAIPTRQALLAVTDRGLMEAWYDDRNHIQPSRSGRITEFSDHKEYEPGILRESTAISSTGVHVIGHASKWAEMYRHEIFSVPAIGQRGRQGSLSFPTREKGRQVSVDLLQRFSWNETDTLLGVASAECPRVFVAEVDKDRGGMTGVKYIQLNDLPDSTMYDLQTLGYNRRATAVMLSANGDHVTALSHDEMQAGIHIFDSRTGASLLQSSNYGFLHGQSLNELDAQDERMRYQDLVVSSNETAYVLDGNGAVSAIFRKATDRAGFGEWERAAPTDIESVSHQRASFAASPDRTLFSCISDNGQFCEVFHADTFRLRQTIRLEGEPAGNITNVRFSPNSTQVVLVTDQGAVYQTDVPRV